jgi:hypothetical protein
MQRKERPMATIRIHQTTTIGKRVLTKAFENTVKAIEARNGAAKATKLD